MSAFNAIPTPATIAYTLDREDKKQKSANEKDESERVEWLCRDGSLQKQNFRMMLNSENIPYTVVSADDVMK